MISFARAGSASAQSMLLARRNANLAWSPSVSSLVRNLGKHRVGLLAPAEPRKCMCANEIRFRSRAGADCRFRESIGEGQIRQPDRAMGCPHEQVGVGCEVGVQTQCGAAHHDSDVVAVIGCGELGGDESAQPPQPGGCARACGAPRRRADAPPAPPRRDRRARA